MTVLVTGAAGFIGFHLSMRLLKRGTAVLGFDNINPYYEPTLKRARIAQLRAVAERSGTPFALLEADLEDSQAVAAAFRGQASGGTDLTPGAPAKVVNLAAQAGLRYSIENPAAYIQSNFTKEFLPMQLGDVPAMAADTSALEAWTGLNPTRRYKRV